MVICVVSILALKLLDWVGYYQERAEKAAMESTHALLQAGMTLRASALFIKGTGADVNALSDQNPMDWLAERPANYLGAFLGAPPEGSPSGVWYFDSAARLLVYRPQRHGHLLAGPDGRYDIRFRAVADYGPVQIGAASGATVPGLRTLRIAATRPYVWFSERAPGLE